MLSSYPSVGTPGLGYPLLLCLGKSLVDILNYALTAEQPDPCGPSPTLPANGPDPLPAWGRSGGAACPGEGSPQPKQLGAPDLLGSSGPPPGPGPLSREEVTPRLGLVRSRHVSTGAGTRAGPRGFHRKTHLPTAFNAVGESALCLSRA